MPILHGAPTLQEAEGRTLYSPCVTLRFTLLSATNRQKTAADEWIKKVISGDTMSKATGLLEEQVPRATAPAPHAHRTRTARAPHAHCTRTVRSIRPNPATDPPRWRSSASVC